MANISWFRMEKKGANRAEVLLYDRIGQGFFDDSGIGAKAFAGELKALGEITHLDIRINSPGGSVFEGLAIYNQLRAHSAKKTVFVDGIAASIASVIAMAGDEIIMPSNAMMMIHDPSGVAVGTVKDFEKMVDMLTKIKEAVVNVYVNRTGGERAHIEALMSNETWMTAKESVEAGFATEEAEAVKMAASFDFSMFHNLPEQLKTEVRPTVGGIIGGAFAKPAQSSPKNNPSHELRTPLAEALNRALAQHSHTLPKKETPAMTEKELQDQLNAARNEGRQEEASRVLGILDFQATNFPDMQDVAIEAIRNSIDLGTAQIAMKNRQFLKVTASAPKSAGGGSEEVTTTPDPNATPDMTGWTVEQKGEWTWEHDESIRNEFMSKSSYLAFLRHDAAGHVRIVAGNKKA